MMKHRLVAWGLTLAMSAGLVTVGVARVAASPEGRRNTTIGLGAATVGAVLMKKKAAAVVLGVGTGVAAYKYHESLQDRKKKRAASRTAQVASYREKVSARRPTRVASKSTARRAPATRVVRTRPSSSPTRVTYVPQRVAPVAEKPVAAAEPVAATQQPVAAAAVIPPVAPAPAGQPFGGALMIGLGALLGALIVGLWAWMRREKSLAR